jgi:hypothetical protein
MIRPVFQDESMTPSATDQLYGYWRSLLRGDDIPHRVDVNPADMRTILPQVFILQREEVDEQAPRLKASHRDVTFRLAGTDLCDTHMKDLSKTSFREMFVAKDRPQVDEELARIFEHEEIKIFRTRIRSEFAFVEVETIVLPIRNGDGECSRAVGCQTLITDKRSLWWKGSHSVSDHMIESVENRLWKAGKVVGDPRLQPPAYEVPVLEFSRRGRRPEGRAVRHLVVIDGGASQHEDA